MFGLTRDFVQNGGTFMVLDLPEGLVSGHLSQVQLGMIRSSRIPHFLPLHTKELDFHVTLEYNITGKRMLSQALKGEKLTLTEFYGLLLQIASALNDSSMYMLRPEQYILNDGYMFIEGPLHLGKLYLTYVPLDKVEPSAETIRSSMKEFLTGLLSCISELRGSGIQSLMHYCNDDGFSLAGLKRLLIELLAGEGDGHREQTEITNGNMNDSKVSMNLPTSAPERSVPASQNQATHRAAIIDHPNNGRSGTSSEELVSKPVKPLFPARNEPEWVMAPEQELHEETDNSSGRVYWLLGGLLGLAVVWRFFYLNNPSDVMLAVSIVVTVMIGAVSLMGWKGKMGRLSADQSDDYSDALPMFDSGELDHGRRGNHKPARFPAEKLTGWFGGKSKGKIPEEEPSSNENWRWESTSISPHVREQPLREALFSQRVHNDEKDAVSSAGDYYNQLPHRTEMLSSAGDGGTVLLQPKADIADKLGTVRPATMPSAFLEVVSSTNGVTERVELHQSHFIIGRSAEVSQYVAQVVGTSRAHVELSRGPGGYIIKDLGSKNGTILEGQAMVPYKEYPLQEGDSFLIAGGKYTFRAS